MSDWSEKRQSLSWIFGGVAVALGVAATAGQYAHAQIWWSIVASRRSFADGRVVAEVLGGTMRGLWGTAIVALLFGAAAFLLGRPGTRARWMAVAGLAAACGGLWVLHEYAHSLKWS